MLYPEIIVVLMQANSTIPQSSCMLILVDKIFTASLGIAAAIITDYFIKRKRERDQNILVVSLDIMREIEIKKRIYYKLSTFRISQNIDFHRIINKHSMSEIEIESTINKAYESSEDASRAFSEIEIILSSIRQSIMGN